MTYTLLAAIAVAFLMGFLVYRKGLQDGLSINKGRDIQPIKNPVQATIDTVIQAKQTVENQKQQVNLMQGLANMMGYTGDEKG